MKQLQEVQALLKKLRDKEQGCTWCQQQDYVSLNKYIFEEAYELRDAIAKNDIQAIKNELADILLQPLFYAQIASEHGDFNFDDIVTILKEKLIQRTKDFDKGNQWRQVKHQQRQYNSLLDGIDHNLPATIRSDKIQTRAADVNFDWETTDAIIEVLDEELNELKQAHQQKLPLIELHKELGDILFTCVNLARHLNTDVDYALNLTNQKFIKRFQYIEKKLQSLKTNFSDLTFEQMLIYWNEAKEYSDGK